MQNTSELLTAAELSVELKLPMQTIYSLTRQGVIPAYRFGRALRYDLSEVRFSGREAGATEQAQQPANGWATSGDRQISRLRAAQLRGAAQRRERASLTVAR